MSVWNGCSAPSRSTCAFSFGQLAKPCSRASSSCASVSLIGRPAALRARTSSFACLRAARDRDAMTRQILPLARRPHPGRKEAAVVLDQRWGGLGPFRGLDAARAAQPSLTGRPSEALDTGTYVRVEHTFLWLPQSSSRRSICGPLCACGRGSRPSPRHSRRCPGGSRSSDRSPRLRRRGACGPGCGSGRRSRPAPGSPSSSRIRRRSSRRGRRCCGGSRMPGSRSSRPRPERCSSTRGGSSGSTEGWSRRSNGRSQRRGLPGTPARERPSGASRRSRRRTSRGPGQALIVSDDRTRTFWPRCR